MGEATRTEIEYRVKEKISVREKACYGVGARCSWYNVFGITHL